MKIVLKELMIFSLSMPYTGSNARLRAEMGDGLRFTPMDEAVAQLYAWYDSIKGTLDKNCLLYDK